MTRRGATALSTMARTEGHMASSMSFSQEHRLKSWCRSDRGWHSGWSTIQRPVMTRLLAVSQEEAVSFLRWSLRKDRG